MQLRRAFAQAHQSEPAFRDPRRVAVVTAAIVGDRQCELPLVDLISQRDVFRLGVLGRVGDGLLADAAPAIQVH